ncbi:MAG: DUF6112 family protein [Acidimicrobiales bacterium]
MTAGTTGTTIPSGQLLGQLQSSSGFHANGALPGSHVLQWLASGIGGWALLLALIGLLVGAATWAIGSHSQNYQHAYTGRRAVLVSGLAALLIGAAPALVRFFYDTGLQVR